MFITTRERAVLEVKDNFEHWRAQVLEKKDDLALITNFRNASKFTKLLPVRVDAKEAIPKHKRKVSVGSSSSSQRSSRRPSFQDEKKGECKYYALGTCSRGNSCRFAHNNTNTSRPSVPKHDAASKKSLTSQSKDKVKRKCYLCNAEGHLQAKCPLKGKVQSFVSRVQQAENDVAFMCVVPVVGDNNETEEDMSTCVSPVVPVVGDNNETEEDMSMCVLPVVPVVDDNNETEGDMLTWALPGVPVSDDNATDDDMPFLEDFGDDSETDFGEDLLQYVAESRAIVTEPDAVTCVVPVVDDNKRN
jgi:hypothetical protein